MFVTKEETLLTDSAADGIFGESIAVDRDFSLQALLRAYAISANNCDSSLVEKIANESRLRVLRAVRFDSSSTLKSIGTGISIVEIVSFDDDSFKTTPSGWNSFDKGKFRINEYLSQIVKTRVFVDEKSRSAAFVVEKRCTSLLAQAIASIIGRICPWYYAEVTPEDQAFFKSISVGSADGNDQKPQKENLIKFVNGVAEKIDLREMFYKNVLGGIEEKLIGKRIADAKRQIENTLAEIGNYERYLEGQYSELYNQQSNLKALNSYKPSGDDKVVGYFSNHKDIVVRSVKDETITYTAIGTLEYYDEDEFDSICQSKHSWFNEYCDENDKKYIKKILIDHVGVIQCCAEFQLTGLSLVRPIKNVSHPNYCPNPHIYFYACSGGNGSYYAKYARSGDWDLAIDQSIAATKNLNMGDSTVCERFLRWLRDNDNVKCIFVNEDASEVTDTKTAKYVSFKEFKKIIDENEKKEN